MSWAKLIVGACLFGFFIGVGQAAWPDIRKWLWGKRFNYWQWRDKRRHLRDLRKTTRKV